MAEHRASGTTEHQMTRPGSDELGEAQAQRAGINFEWHFGRVTSMGVYGLPKTGTSRFCGKKGASATQQGEITDEQWEIFKLAFVGSGRIAILSDQEEKGWMYDYRFLEALRGRSSLPYSCHMNLCPFGYTHSVLERSHGMKPWVLFEDRASSLWGCDRSLPKTSAAAYSKKIRKLGM